MPYPEWMKQIALPGEHRNKPVIWLPFPYDKQKIAAVKSFQARYSHTKKSWYLPDASSVREGLGLPLKSPVGKNILARIAPVNQPTLHTMDEQLILKGYSINTRRVYVTEFAQLLYLLGEVPVSCLSTEKIRSYLLYCHQTLQLSENQIHSRLNAIRFYFEQVLGREKMFVDIPRPKKPAQLPKVLSTRDIKKLFAACENPKHQLMLQLCYGMGLRVSEVVALKIEHIDSTRMQVLVAGAKGKKDRYVQLPATVLQALRDYYRQYQPKDYLFEGQYGGAYSTRSVQAVFKNAMRKAGIRKSVGVHSLRHSYATHLHEYGTDIGFIQKLLGHNNIKTTLIYTQVSHATASRIQSPLDRLR
jgi:integrase/recombinase XerD